MAKKLILFNGPRHSGKDTAADYVWQCYPNTYRFKMSRPLKDSIKAFFQLTSNEVEMLEKHKTMPSPLLFNHSYVDVQISMSEAWAKELFGMRVLGHLAMRHIDQSPCKLFVCSDTGFDYETEPLVARFGKNNTLLIRLHRPGKTFEGDSRSYIDLPGVMTINLCNAGEVYHFQQQLKELIDAWLEQSDN